MQINELTTRLDHRHIGSTDSWGHFERLFERRNQPNPGFRIPSVFVDSFELGYKQKRRRVQTKEVILFR